jgi:hypothetical protein
MGARAPAAEAGPNALESGACAAHWRIEACSPSPPPPQRPPHRSLAAEVRQELRRVCFLVCG